MIALKSAQKDINGSQKNHEKDNYTAAEVKSEDSETTVSPKRAHKRKHATMRGPRESVRDHPSEHKVLGFIVNVGGDDDLMLSLRNFSENEGKKVTCVICEDYHTTMEEAADHVHKKHKVFGSYPDLIKDAYMLMHAGYMKVDRI